MQTDDEPSELIQAQDPGRLRQEAPDWHTAIVDTAHSLMSCAQLAPVQPWLQIVHPVIGLHALTLGPHVH